MVAKGTKVCKFCNTEFEIYENHCSKIFCSIKCSNKSRSTGKYNIRRRCPICRKFFFITKSKKKFCSRGCADRGKCGRKSSIEKVCSVCGKKFFVTKSSINFKRCSLDCRKKYFESQRKTFKCLICGKEFIRRPFQIRNGSGGKFCSRACTLKAGFNHFKASSQELVLNILDTIIGELGEREKTFSWLKNNKKDKGDKRGHYFVDGYYSTLNLAVEYHGIQHYMFHPRFHKDIKDFEKAIYRDKRKLYLLKRHNCKILVIKYDEILSHAHLYKRLCDLGIKKWYELEGYRYDYIDALSIDKNRLENIVNIFKKISLYGGKIFVCGNGGSYSTALHAEVDWLKVNNLNVMSLGSSGSVLTAFSNDDDYAISFSNQLKRVFSFNSVLCCFSVSGTSPNIVETIKTMRNMGGKVILFVGKLTGKNKWVLKLVDEYLSVKSEDFGVVETVHQAYVHIICNSLLENEQENNKYDINNIKDWYKTNKWEG